MLDINDIPSEIMELIFRNLSARTLFITAQVCKSWRSVASRLCKLRCGGLPDEVVSEWILNDDNDELRWILLSRTLEIDKCFYEQDLRGKETFWEENHDWMTIWGPWLLLVDPTKQSLRIYNEETMEEPCIINIDGIEQVETTQELIIVRSTADILFYKPNPFIFTGFRLLGVELDDSSLLNDVQLMRYLVIVNSGSEIKAFKVHCGRHKLALTYLKTFEASSDVIFISLWNDQLMCTTYAGTVETYDLISMSAQSTISHNEIQYANPTWSLRGALLCSTKNMRTLMDDWHPHPEFSQNLFGRPTQALEECIIWDDDEEVISATVLGRFLAIGTSSGTVALYHLSDNYFKNDNKLMSAELNRLPEIRHECFIQPKFLHLQYTVNGIRFFVSDREAVSWVDYDVYTEN